MRVITSRCRARMEELAAEIGVSMNIAIVEGDDLMAHIPELAKNDLQEIMKRG